MPRPRFHRLPTERRNHILEVATRHFAADGFGGASLNRILDEAGVSKGAAYYYFDDKGDLFATAVEHALSGLFGDLGLEETFDPARFVGPRFWDELLELYRRQLALFLSHGAEWRMIKVVPEALSDASASRLAPRVEAFMTELTRLFEQAREMGFIRRDLPSDLLLQMLSSLDDAVDRWLLDHPDVLAEDPELPMRTFAALRALLESPSARGPIGEAS